MPGPNRELAKIFQQTADLIEIVGENKFKAAAYSKAARCLEDLPTDITGMKGDELLCVEGLGKGMVARIEEYVRTRKIDEYERLAAEVPPGVMALARVPGIGPKTVATLWKQGGVTDIDTLLKKIDSGELEKLPRMGKKKLEGIRKSIEFAATAAQRLRIGQAMPLAEWLVAEVKKLPGVQRVEYAGSLRRGKETVGDLDLICAADPEDADAITEAFTKLEIVVEVLGLGSTKASVRVSWAAGHVNTQVDLRVVPPEAYGAALLYFTGSKEHNVGLRGRAIDRGLRLNEYGVFAPVDAEAAAGAAVPDDPHLPPAVAGLARVAAATEHDVYRVLGLAWVPPELREDHGEVALAERGDLPRLIELADIRSELHSHTVASDGAWTVRQWAEHAVTMGYHTIAITDHSRSQFQANGLSAERLEKHIEDVRAVAEEFAGRLTVLAGSEVDILGDGRLDYPDSLLKELDIVVASPHAPLKQEPDKATARLLRAIENPYVTVLGHPTGRIIGYREGIQPDMEQVVKAAAQRGIAVEINANHHRLDLRDAHARLALDAGCVLAINTDAHGPGDLGELRYGVLTARRAGATADRVVNAFDAAKLREWITSTRR